MRILIVTIIFSILSNSFGFWGNGNDVDFIDLWNNEQVKKFAETYKTNPICSKCVMRRPLQNYTISEESKGEKEKRTELRLIFTPRKRLLIKLTKRIG